MGMIYLAGYVFAAAMLNRLRGDGRWMAWFGLRGRALWYVASAIGLLSLSYNDVLVSLSISLAYLIWALPAWGRWFDMNRMDEIPRNPPDWYESIVDHVSGGSDAVAMFIRHLMIIPGAVLVSMASGSLIPVLMAVPAAAALTICYELGWRISSRNPILVAELLAGSIWGVMSAIV